MPGISIMPSLLDPYLEEGDGQCREIHSRERVHVDEAVLRRVESCLFSRLCL